MKTLITSLTALLLFSTTSAHAGWGSSTVSGIQMSINSGLIYVFLDTAVAFDCQPGPKNQQTATTPITTNRIIMRQSSSTPNFDAMYSQLMAYQHNDKPVDVLSTSGDCTQSGSSNTFYIDGPYLRFS